MYWLGRYLDLVTLTYILAAVADIIYVSIPDLLKCKTSSHQTLHSASPRCTDSAGILTRWPWPIFCAPVTDTIYVDIPDLLNYKAYNYQTLHSASRRCTDSAGTLTQWTLPIFCAPVTSIHFASTFDISLTIRPTTIKPCKVLLLNVLTRQIPWPGDLDLYFGCSDWHNLRLQSRSQV